MKKTGMLISMSVGATLFLSACGHSTNNAKESSTSSEKTVVTSNNMESMEEKVGSSDMDMKNHTTDTSNINRMVEDKRPKYPVGSHVIIKTDHMEGMDGAKATVKGAFDTTLYEVTYKKTTTGETVKNHKWVIQEELATENTNTNFKEGDKVTLKANHMEGMDGAEATIEKVVPGTAYMVDYTPTNGGKEVKDHKWLTEEELEQA